MFTLPSFPKSLIQTHSLEEPPILTRYGSVGVLLQEFSCLRSRTCQQLSIQKITTVWVGVLTIVTPYRKIWDVGRVRAVLVG